jgi:hypothetical protein
MNTESYQIILAKRDLHHLFHSKGYVLSTDTSRLNFLTFKVKGKEVNDELVNTMILAIRVVQNHKLNLNSIWIRSAYCGFTIRNPFSCNPIDKAPQEFDKLKFNLQTEQP